MASRTDSRCCVPNTMFDTIAAILAIAMVHSRVEATDCTYVTGELLENCDQWTDCVKSAGVRCYNPQGEPDAGL